MQEEEEEKRQKKVKGKTELDKWNEQRQKEIEQSRKTNSEMQDAHH